MTTAVFNIRHYQVEVRGLPRRQAETLAHTVAGHNSKQTAKIMGISPRTVEMNLNLNMARYGADNRVQLVADAVADGVLIIKRTTRVLTFCLVAALSVAVLPGAGAPDDLNRLPVRGLRTTRVRRKNETEIAIIHTTEDDEA